MPRNPRYTTCMLPRAIAGKLKKLAAQFQVVVVAGPRQSGKTTLAKMTFPGYSYVSLEDADNRRYAIADPRGFLARYNKRVIIDEVQRAPDILSYMQTLVDGHPLPGRYILTGSQQFNLLHKAGQSLAGRAAYLRLLPFTVSELYRLKPANPAQFPAVKRRTLNARLDEVLYAGFYPRIHHEHIAPADFLSSYIAAYIERDVRDVLRIGDLLAFQNFVRLCAGRSGQILNLSSLGADCGISHTTARQWLSVLEASSLVFTLQPFYRNFSKRLIKSPKLYFLDTGLLCHLLQIRNPAQLGAHPLYGAIFETFAVAEIYKSFCHAGKTPPLYFWRDRTGREVDLLIDGGARLAAVEIKAGRTIADDFFRNLRHFSAAYSGPARAADISRIDSALVYAGDDSYNREGVAVRNWRQLS